MIGYLKGIALVATLYTLSLPLFFWTLKDLKAENESLERLIKVCENHDPCQPENPDSISVWYARAQEAYRDTVIARSAKMLAIWRADSAKRSPPRRVKSRRAKRKPPFRGSLRKR